MKRLAVVAWVAVAIVVGGSATASAERRQESPPLMLNPSQVAPGGTVIASVRITCRDGDTINLDIQAPGDPYVAICTADVFEARLTAPSRPGTYRVTAAGINLATQADLTVTAAVDDDGQPLPSTGPEQAVSIAIFGGVLLAGGVALLRLARSRQPWGTLGTVLTNQQRGDRRDRS